MAWNEREKVPCPQCGSRYLLFFAPVVECHRSGAKVRTQQIGARYVCDDCGTMFRVTRYGVVARKMPEARSTDGGKPPSPPPSSPGIPIRTRRP